MVSPVQEWLAYEKPEMPTRRLDSRPAPSTISKRKIKQVRGPSSFPRVNRNQRAVSGALPHAPPFAMRGHSYCGSMSKMNATAH